MGPTSALARQPEPETSNGPNAFCERPISADARTTSSQRVPPLTDLRWSTPATDQRKHTRAHDASDLLDGVRGTGNLGRTTHAFPQNSPMSQKLSQSAPGTAWALGPLLTSSHILRKLRGPDLSEKHRLRHIFVEQVSESDRGNTHFQQRWSPPDAPMSSGFGAP